MVRPPVLHLRGPIAPAELPELCALVRALARDADGPLACHVEGVAPDLQTVESLARLVLAARREGRDLRLEVPSTGLRGLIALCGLGAVLRSRPLPIEARGQSEEREEPGGVEEEGDPGDPAP